jgi:hypothetical protein
VKSKPQGADLKPWGVEPKPWGAGSKFTTLTAKFMEAAMIMSSLIWTKNDVAVELSGGIVAGGKGLFGQFHDNSFIREGLKYTF